MNVNWLVLPTLVAALLLFAVGQMSVRRCRTSKSKLGLSAAWFLLGVPGYLIPAYYLHCFDEAKWFYEFRSLPFTELTAAGAGLFAGALAEWARGSTLASRPFLITVLILGIIVPYIKPVVTPLPRQLFIDRWQDDVCMQSTPSSCGAASAATVFKALGLPLEEQAVARECFTSLGGTENWYLARAFRRRGFQVRYRIVDGFPAKLLTPAIAGVRVSGNGHFIAIIGSTNGMYVTGDPLFGRQTVGVDQVETVFDFTGFFMEIRKEN